VTMLKGTEMSSNNGIRRSALYLTRLAKFPIVILGTPRELLNFFSQPRIRRDSKELQIQRIC
jgi:hypothetical protein